ncbi:hypothetical protein B0T17DRAFT_634275 [Bombardia bombarda]|uniref:Protein kinase domain-containing protein n=1 Tax=Bombardia bombarda TaxID=252184 RepID=A0AA39X8V3_9PEZI|nr:hypothetical protein B0T17DRAFT_634275 [Bombardia bombarda]
MDSIYERYERYERYGHDAMHIETSIDKETPYWNRDVESSNLQTTSSQWLNQRPKGFVLVNQLSHSKTGLFVTVDQLHGDGSHEFVVVKKITDGVETSTGIGDEGNWGHDTHPGTLSPDILVTTLNDPLAIRAGTRLPTDMAVFAETHAAQVHNFDPSDATQMDATLFLKYYNGGTISDFVKKHVKAGEAVPETFIWHFVAQVGKAYSWLHARGIAHLNGHEDNFFLHYPTDEEKAQDPRMAQFDNIFPQIVMGGFGSARLNSPFFTTEEEGHDRIYTDRSLLAGVLMLLAGDQENWEHYDIALQHLLNSFKSVDPRADMTDRRIDLEVYKTHTLENYERIVKGAEQEVQAARTLLAQEQSDGDLVAVDWKRSGEGRMPVILGGKGFGDLSYYALKKANISSSHNSVTAKEERVEYEGPIVTELDTSKGPVNPGKLNQGSG